MENTFIGVIIGAICGALPGVLSTFASLRENQQQREHEMRMKQFDLVVVPRINAILGFCESIGKCVSIPRGKITTEEHQAIYADYLVSYERVYPCVSDSTRKAMEILGDPLSCDVCDDCISKLNACLGEELRNIFHDADRPADRRNKLHSE